MAHATLKLLPGVDKNRTPTFNEAAISFSEKIRFQPDKQGVALPQKLGGWLKYYNTALSGVARAIWAWEDSNVNPYLSVGTTKSLFALNNISNQNANLTGIYPQSYSVNVAVSATTTVGSSLVTITDSNSTVSTGDTVRIVTHISVGGLVLFGNNFNCTNVLAASTTLKYGACFF